MIMWLVMYIISKDHINFVRIIIKFIPNLMFIFYSYFVALNKCIDLWFHYIVIWVHSFHLRRFFKIFLHLTNKYLLFLVALFSAFIFLVYFLHLLLFLFLIYCYWINNFVIDLWFVLFITVIGVTFNLCGFDYEII